MSGRTVIFDLDDTLIVEEAVAWASLIEASKLCTGREPAEVAEEVLASVRRVWRAGPYYPLCRELGIASWEGLWATFQGGHPALERMRVWASTYRVEAWRSAVAALGVREPDLAAATVGAYIEHQRRGHPLVDSAARLVQVLGSRPLPPVARSHPAHR